EADKLYIETLDDGSGEERIILSGLVPYCTEEELLGKSVIIADNLKPRKMRGIESRGMLLAADYTDSEGKDHVEVLHCPWAEPGTPVVLEGQSASAIKADSIDADTFFSVEITVNNKVVNINGIPLTADGKVITTSITENGQVG
ncbi:MAG TPA: methionine--tRNA ligase, partial [Treponemataceae bacterium]|nr:methionine--tRNA ligase [Treponemataceae bacterium]